MERDQEKKYVTSGNFCWRVRVLMALCFLPQARGHVQLLPPQNVTLMSKDFEMILAWTPGEGSPPDVTYTVRYTDRDHVDKWMKVPHCKNIRRTSCTLTCVIRNRYVEVQARVKAVSGRLQSPWVESQFKDYYSEVELAPPVLILNVKKNSVHVNASFPLPSCMEHLSWKYELNCWEAGSEDKKKYEEKFRKELIIDTTALRGNYCFSARSLFDSIELKHSEFSQPVCVLLNHKAGEWKLPLSAVILLCALLILLTGAFILCFLKQDAKQRKMPQALDFHHLKAAGPALPLDLSEKEFCSDDLNCTERPVAQRKTNRAAAGDNLPFLLPSSSSEEEEDEDEDEDSGTFIPYNQMTRFPKGHLNCQPPQAAPGESSLGLGSGGVSVHRESVLGLSTLGFSLFPDRKDEWDTSGSQANEEASLCHSSSSGRMSLTDVRFPGPREHGEHDADRDERLEMIPLEPLVEGGCAKCPRKKHHLHEKEHHFSNYYQKSITDLQLQVDEMPQLGEDPNIQLLIPLWTLQVAEDEGIASDCDSDSFSEGTPPTSTLLSDTFEPSNTQEKYDQKLKFEGYSHAHYLGRT